MSYDFIENKYPLSDPNININFNDDILYRHIVDNDDQIDFDVDEEQKPLPARDRIIKKQKKIPIFNTYLVMTIMFMLVLMIWYFNMPVKSNNGKMFNLNSSDYREIGSDFL
jgi:hypothetical protein